MPEPLAFTGERFLPSCSGEIWLEHWHRYAFASQYATGLTVLDVASGEGYGSHMLAQQGAGFVAGVDLSPEAASHAASRYGDRANYIAASCALLPFADAAFDMVVSFETIEHISAADQTRMLAEIRRVLKPEGFLLLSSPNKKTYSDDRQYRNEFHLHELYRSELDELLSQYFPSIRWFGQKLAFNSVIWPESANLGASWLAEQNSSIERADAFPAEAMYFLALCGQSQAVHPGKVSETSLLVDANDAVYHDYEKSVRLNVHLDALLQERERLIVERDNQLETKNAQNLEREGMIVERDRIIAERDALLEMRTSQMSERERLIEERDALLALRTGQLDELHRRVADDENQLAGLRQALSDRSSWRWWLKRAFGLVR